MLPNSSSTLHLEIHVKHLFYMFCVKLSMFHIKHVLHVVCQIKHVLHVTMVHLWKTLHCNSLTKGYFFTPYVLLRPSSPMANPSTCIGIQCTIIHSQFLFNFHIIGYCLQVLVPTTGPSYTNPVQNNLLKAYWSHGWRFACFHCIAWIESMKILDKSIAPETLIVIRIYHKGAIIIWKKCEL